jgi:NADPH2:quinone reductase
MRAVRIHETGGPDVLNVEDLEVSEPGAGEIRVRVEVAGVNYIDTYHRNGRYPLDLPASIGLEAAGVVDAVGSGVTGIAVGDRVAYADQPNAYAEIQVVKGHSVVKVPEGVELRIAAAAMLQGMTAHYLAHDTYSLKPGEVALVHAAAGGTGHLLTQVCKIRGAHVIATCGTHEKADIARDLGADEVVVHTEESFVEAVKRSTEGRGVDVVYDGVGAATFGDSLRCLRRRGLMVLYGQASGPVEPIDPQELNRLGSLFLTRPTLFNYVSTRDELERRTSDLFGWIKDGRVRVRIDRTFPLEEAAEAHRYLEGRRTRGKVLLTPSRLEG